MKFYAECEINDTLNAEFYADFERDNDGIGNERSDYWVMDSGIEWSIENHTSAENKMIEKFLYENEQQIENDLYKKAESFKPSDYM